MIFRDQQGRFANINDELRAAAGHFSPQASQAPAHPATAVSFDGGTGGVVGVGTSPRAEPSLNDAIRDAWRAQLLGRGFGA